MPTLETPEFTLALDDGWVQVIHDVTDRYVFDSPLRNASLTVTTEPMLTGEDELDAVAAKLVDHRIETHLTAARTHGWLFEMVDPVIVAQDWGRMVAYHGRLQAGGAFSYAGLVLPRGVVSLFVESETAPAEALSEMLNEVASGMDLGAGVHGQG
ncbi:hypothetical protein [Caulobacter sp. NIBR1757]|uniref:hypothetical protein n=1 Tax=Caulobacter sp. NIBR1757 TaxID=3016000 RepID=UPI0022F11F60|nr:hypothetical protein [Caulobacter sp. NIBR1757]WGM40532.1 hypothetical protein AMEJIAPC_03477 [Caulobacter sp. NIBR1757]